VAPFNCIVPAKLSGNPSNSLTADYADGADTNPKAGMNAPLRACCAQSAFQADLAGLT
jgi:hypothetical protein